MMQIYPDNLRDFVIALAIVYTLWGLIQLFQ